MQEAHVVAIERASFETKRTIVESTAIIERIGCGRIKDNQRRMECRAKIIIEKEAVEKIVEEKVWKMIKKVNEECKRREEEMKEEIERLKKKVDRMEQSGGKRKRNDSEESKTGKKKWWAEELERSDNEKRRNNVIIRVEKKRWEGEGSNWEKVKELFADGLKVKVEVKEVIVIGVRGDWITILVKMRSEEDKWKVLVARRKEGSRLRVKMDEDKSVETREREREENKRRKERREEESGSLKKTEKDEITKRMKESPMMESGEEKDDKKEK
ncbi:vicilin-like seed storage protein At2g18540 [Temnothorax curvispinosus]|uniref:Vicilin-like seed storage protein At2g18540 n=1 Tax=Temnothorax curvispinosus TaxID=300111 RepID=A0A6J1QNP0_9HYME|nr:vicilin-like seed storage protein At2g18540 [Temnothorax curvispinosus]